MKIDWTTFNLPEFFAAFLLSLSLWILDKLRRPNFFVEIADPSNLELEQGKFRSVNIKVANERRRGWKSFFNQTATQVRVYLIFKDYDSKKPLFNKIVARWNTTREPLTPDYKQVDVGLALTNPREVISPGEEASVPIAIKKEGNKNFYPFTNESYLHSDFSKSEWELEDNRIIVSVQVHSAEIELKEVDFLITHKKQLSQFNISKL